MPLSEYANKDQAQAQMAFTLVAKMGEFMPVSIGARTFKVSRHCIALHGVSAAEIDSYGFEQL